MNDTNIHSGFYINENMMDKFYTHQRVVAQRNSVQQHHETTSYDHRDIHAFMLCLCTKWTSPLAGDVFILSVRLLLSFTLLLLTALKLCSQPQHACFCSPQPQHVHYPSSPWTPSFFLYSIWHKNQVCITFSSRTHKWPQRHWHGGKWQFVSGPVFLQLLRMNTLEQDEQLMFR